MVKKLIVRVKTGEETNKTVKQRNTFYDEDATVVGEIGTNLA